MTQGGVQHLRQAGVDSQLQNIGQQNTSYFTVPESFLNNSAISTE